MGREVRQVPPNWDHPRDARGEYKSMYNQTFEQAAAEWKAGFSVWEAGDRPAEYAADEYWEYAGDPPSDREDYRPWSDEEATWFQLWETVSEGSPVSPPFATKEDLANYLAKNGDFWDQHRGAGGWGHRRAAAFMEDEWAPSMMVSGGQMYESKDIPLALADAHK